VPDSHTASNGTSDNKHTYAQIATLVSDSLVAEVSKVCEKSNRDIIFVAHGLGGLIVKDALSTSAVSQVFGKHTDEFGNIYSKTRGIIFLGTPHRGSGRESLGNTIAAVAQMESRRQDDVFVQMVRENGDLFETQRDEFILVSRDIHVVCVREQLPTPAAMVSGTAEKHQPHILANHSMRTKIDHSSTDVVPFTSNV
jgi:predicted alpha/beta hydrolase family esterase